MRCNIYDGERIVSYSKFFLTFQNAKSYCKYVLPRILGPGRYYPVILK